MMKNKRYKLLFFLIMMMIMHQTIFAQETIPREYTNPDEVIALNSQMSYQEALQVIDTYAQEFEGRFIIDRTGFTGSVGLNLPAMHWKDALGYILRVHDFILVQEDDFYEILTAGQVQQNTAESDPVTTGSTGTTSGLNATTRTREVRINATFFEGNRRALTEIGVDWSTLTNGVPGNILDFVTDESSDELPEPDFGGRFVQVSARGAQNVSQNVFNSLINFGDVGYGIEVQALFSAFEADNIGEVLATPTVKVVDGQEGRIQVGEDFSIKQRDFAGNVTDNFVSTGTILTVTPQIIEFQDTTFIYLDLIVERSSAQPDPVSTIISKEQAETHTLLLDGESTVVAGLYNTSRTEVRRGIPILKDLPPWFFGLRYLFGYNSQDITQSELIVVVQAELEDTIPQRMASQFQSSRSLIEGQQERNRTFMDIVPENTALGAVPVSDSDSVAETDSMAIARYDLPVSITVANNIESTDFQPRYIEPEPEEYEIPFELEEQPSLYNVDNGYSHLTYYVIGGVFSQRENADSLYQELESEGYEPHLLINQISNLYLVSFAGFEDYEPAARYLTEIKSSVQSDAWLSSVQAE